jgi:RimJ/RimL family protein N-acetyltransferase
LGSGSLDAKAAVRKSVSSRPATRYEKRMERLQTKSLLLDPLTRDDFPWLFALYADRAVMRYIASGPRSEATARANLEGLLAQAERLPFGYWVLRDRATGERLGGAALMVRREGLPVELGFLLAQNAWGRGLATEAARALIAHALGVLEVPLVQAFIDVNNAASGSVLRKSGLRDEGLAEGPYGGIDRRFALTRAEWLEARSGPP